MSIDTKLAELEYLRDATLREMGDNATLLSEHIKTQYSPARMLRRHVRPALGFAATVAVLIARSKAPHAGALRTIWSQLFNRARKHSAAGRSSNGVASVDPTAAAAADGQATPAAKDQNHHGLRDLVKPIIRNILLDVAQSIPWK